MHRANITSSPASVLFLLPRLLQSVHPAKPFTIVKGRQGPVVAYNGNYILESDGQR
jgi:hypothetical protein